VNPGTAIAAFALADVRALARDPLLRLLLVAPLGLTGVLVLGVPLVEGFVDGAFGMDLTAHRTVLVAFLACVTMPLFLGAMAGLLVLEDRESGVLPAVAVSPAGLRSYFIVRCGWAGIAATATVAGALLLYGGASAGVVAATSVLGGGYAVVVLLLVGTLAGDRLEGMVVVKALTLPFALALLVGYLAAPWSWLLVVLPSYSPVVALLDGTSGRSLAPVIGVGVVQLSLWIWLLTHRANRW
jgi:fluoroquinolone transport system permease protein